MRINLKKLKLHPRQKETFIFKGKMDESLLMGTGAAFIEDIDVIIDVEYTGNVFLAHGKVNTILSLSCSRCLNEFFYKLDNEFFVTLVQDINSKEFQEDQDIFVFSNDEADMSEFIEEAILVAIPLSPVCDRDCKGICPICGVDKNTVKCKCQEEEIDPRWEKLKNLK